jgi:hypothetical protein
MRGPSETKIERRQCVERCLLRWRIPGAGIATRGAVLDAALEAYGDMRVHEICDRIGRYARDHSAELEDLLKRQTKDPRRPPLLEDVALLCVLERLEHDRYALRRAWVGQRDPVELRRVADLWGVRLGP